MIGLAPFSGRGAAWALPRGLKPREGTSCLANYHAFLWDKIHSPRRGLIKLALMGSVHSVAPTLRVHGYRSEHIARPDRILRAFINRILAFCE